MSDRLLEHTNTVAQRVLTEQHLDSMDLEKERGITIKSHPVTMTYRAKDGQDYKLNLMDTPGHVDFSYEVSRSLAACEGALLLIDAAQGVEAQTVANAHLAFGQNLKVIPVINKIDLPSANLDLCLRQLEDILTISAEEAILASGKAGIGIVEILEAVVTRVPPPRWTDYPQPRALVFDSKYDQYKGVLAYVRVVDGAIEPGRTLRMMQQGTRFEPVEIHAEAVAFLPRARLTGTSSFFGTANGCKYSGVKRSTDQSRPRVTRSRYRGSPTVSLLCPRVVLKTRPFPY